VTGIRPVAALRFREALAGGMLWLLPLHFVLAFAVVRTLPGPTPEARLQAADATALGLAAVLGLVAAAVMGASPLAAERLRARGTLVRSAPVSPAARVLGTALGTGAALLLLVAGLCASAMAAVDFGVGGALQAPRAFVRAVSLEGGEPDPHEPGLVWLTKRTPRATARFPEATLGDLEIDARPRFGAGSAMPGRKEAEVFLIGFGPPGFTSVRGMSEVLKRDSRHATASLHAPFRLMGKENGVSEALISRVEGNLDLGIRIDGVRIETGPRARAMARSLHAMALGAGLIAAMGAAMTISTVTGAGVGAGGALALALLCLFRTLFADAASTLAYAGSMERAIEAGGGGHVDAVALTGTPPALAPVFEALARALPEGTRFDFSAVLAAGEVPDAGDVGRAAILGLGIAAGFLVVAVLGARRRP
jgi:hypothetical protein